jgi:hypothetical protein
MAVTTGFVQRLWVFGGPFACIWVGSAPNSAELLFVQITGTDSDATRAFKRSIIHLFADAQVTGQQVDVAHPDNSGEVTNVGTTYCNDTQNPLQLDAMEVTQAVQDLNESVPLIAGKATIVRLYLSCYSSPGVTVRGQISVRRAPSAPPVTIPSLNTVVLDPAQAGNIPVKRNDATRSLNFPLPYPSTGVGQLSISINSITNVVTGIPMVVGCERRPTVWFHASPPLRVRVIGFRYSQGSPPVTYTPSSLDFQGLISWLGRAYPVGQVLSSQAVVDATASPPFGCGDINAQLAAIRALDVAGGTDQRTHYYGLVSDGGFFMRGCAGVPVSAPDPSSVGSGPTGPGTWGWDFDGTYGDWYGGHELGHTYGRLHPGFCGETQDDLNNYPFPNGQLASSDPSFAGFDMGDPVLGFAMAALTGTQWHDVMTYCNFQWLSAYTYQGVRRRLLAEDALGAGSGAGSSPGPGSGGGMSPGPSSGRPDERFPQQAATPLRDAAAAGPRENLVSVVATVNLTRNQGQIRFVNPVPKGRPSGLEEDSPVVVRVEGVEGGVLHEHAVRVKLDSELAPEDDRTGLVDAVIAVDAGAKTIELVVGGRVADAFTAAGAPPAVRAARTVVSDDGTLGVALELDRAMEETHTYSIQVSTDQGKTWQTLGVGLKEPSFSLDRSQFRPGQEVQVRVIATNGFESSVVISETFRV